MNTDIMETIATAAAALTAGQTFGDESGGSAAIQYHKHVMPAKSKTAGAEAMPFCLVKAKDFILYPRRQQTVELIYVFYRETRATALSDMDRLAGLIEPLAQRGRNLGGWKIVSITGYPGDKETGVQPHPEYYLTVVIDLIAPPVQ